ncbi:MAG TPA: hypothetical protein VK966_00635 [Longimicrobiales bacterium]|nr:hypothetical protein [Longimicrobiales bacterium]
MCEQRRHRIRSTLMAALVLSAWIAAPAAALAQTDTSGSGPADGFLPPVPAEMEAVSWLEGEWEGEGWMERGGRRMEFQGGEKVERRMGGRLLVVEGDFAIEAGDRRIPVHQALGIISWAPDAGYTFRTYTARGGGGEAHGAAVSDGRVVWGFESPDGSRIRYTITRTAEGLWLEEGHVSSGGDWRQFFEMTLRPVR